MEISIEVTRDEIFRNVSRRMEWEATRSPAADKDYSRESLSEADRSLFHSLFDEAVMHAMDMCRPFLKSVSNTDDGLKMTMTVQDCIDKESVELTMANMLTAHVLGQWQDIVRPTRTLQAMAKRDDYGYKLQSLLYHHPAPKRERSNDA